MRRLLLPSLPLMLMPISPWLLLQNMHLYFVKMCTREEEEEREKVDEKRTIDSAFVWLTSYLYFSLCFMLANKSTKAAGTIEVNFLLLKWFWLRFSLNIIFLLQATIQCFAKEAYLIPLVMLRGERKK